MTCTCLPSGLVCTPCAMAAAQESIARRNEGTRSQAYIDAVLTSAATRHGVQVRHILSRSRVTDVVAARKDAARQLKSAGLRPGVIGKVLGRDRTTVMYFCRGMQ